MSTPPQTFVPAEPPVHPDHDRGPEFDVRTLMARRSALGLISGAGLLALVGCSDGTSTSASSTSATGSATARATASAAASDVDSVVPDETAGPFPGGGSNGIDVLDDSGIVRRDIRSSFGTSTTTAAGVPLTVNLTVLDSAGGYAALEDVAVYAWHADGQGRYSMYSQGVEGENYLRGVQPTDAAGTASFITAFPGCYDGRWPDIHFAGYRGTKEATSDGQIVKTSQIALTQAACEAVYADATTYPSGAANLARTSLTRDMVFATTAVSTSSRPSRGALTAATSPTSRSVCEPGRGRSAAACATGARARRRGRGAGPGAIAFFSIPTPSRG